MPISPRSNKLVTCVAGVESRERYKIDNSLHSIILRHPAGFFSIDGASLTRARDSPTPHGGHGGRNCRRLTHGLFWCSTTRVERASQAEAAVSRLIFTASRARNRRPRRGFAPNADQDEAAERVCGCRRIDRWRVSASLGWRSYWRSRQGR